MEFRGHRWIQGFLDALSDTESRRPRIQIPTNLSELKSIGRTYTWSNGRTCSKIDRAIVNGEWMLNMIPMEVTVLNPGTSDHSHLSLELDRQRRCSHKAFKFSIMLLSIQSFYNE
ncbi:hypothetical protein H5410_013742 [Solanum commersonii]|uniref:Endonuclease/exonuclease/phosphatase domain-containing protein n=1 Tax=Solanum commersonii TaxID=4109 RepID=A0A9J5ZP27_SOLCO|nr:hypothetical protein H5410_013742 [Solanum commersonii]